MTLELRRCGMLESFEIRTGSRFEMVDITSSVARIVSASGVREGLAVVFVPHTTAAVTINENADPSVVHDILQHLRRLVPSREDYTHVEGNSDSHILSTMTGCSLTLVVTGGRPLLGRWQGIQFCEFDGPRTRTVHVKVMEG